MPRLITIPFSHYCEKARWALDRAGIPFEEDGHLPIFHYLPTWRAGATRTVPIVIDGATRLTDSTDIIAWADARTPGSLLPRDPTTRAAALVLEDDFDRQLGPATRRWGYSQLMPRRDLDATVLTRGVPRWEAALLRLTRPVAVALLRRGLNITREGSRARSSRSTRPSPGSISSWAMAAATSRAISSRSPTSPSPRSAPPSSSPTTTRPRCRPSPSTPARPARRSRPGAPPLPVATASACMRPSDLGDLRSCLTRSQLADARRADSACM